MFSCSSFLRCGGRHQVMNLFWKEGTVSLSWGKGLLPAPFSASCARRQEEKTAHPGFLEKTFGLDSNTAGPDTNR